MRMRAPFTPATAGRTVGFSVRVDMISPLGSFERAAGNRLLADDLEAEAFEAHDALLAVGQQDHFLHAEIDQDLGADAVVAQLAARHLDVLAGATALLGQHDRLRLADQDDDAAALLRYLLHRGLDLAATSVIALAEGIGEDVDGVHAHQDRAARCRVALHQRDVLGHRHLVQVHDAAELAAVGAVERVLAETAHDRVVAAAIGDQVGDGADLETVALGEGDEVVAARHRAVVVHDLADHAGGREAEIGSTRLNSSHITISYAVF